MSYVGAKIEKNISALVENDLCTGCGTCFFLCPTESIKMEINRKKGTYIPKIDANTCNLCGYCLKVCPGEGIDFCDSCSGWN
jgi:coenzyme F420 hydrogenase subunit beta